jgi:fumarate hydratase subunit beta
LCGDSMSAKCYRLPTKITESEARRLRTGDRVFLTGELLTLRDMAHLRALELLRSGEELPFQLEGRVIYHCGPLVKGRTVVSAGPTTSMRMERSEAELIRRSGLRGIVGKGGMGESTVAALSDCGAVYLEYPGGAGALAAKATRGVMGVHWTDLGDPEAVWAIAVEDFGPCFVSMDSHGGSLRKSEKKK